MIGEASIFPRARATIQSAIQVHLQFSPRHLESMFADMAVLAAVAQRQRGLQNGLDTSRKLRPCPSDLDHLAAAAQQVSQASLMEGVHKLAIDTPSLAHQKSMEVWAQPPCGLFKSTSRLDGIDRHLRTREPPHPPQLCRHFPASFIGGYAGRGSNPFH